MPGKVAIALSAWVIGIFTARVLANHPINITTNAVGKSEEINFKQGSNQSKLTLFDFTRTGSNENWIEQSDTVRDVGMSKASLVIQNTQVFRRAIFFSLLNPQPNGAGFAGMRIPVQLDLTAFNGFQMKARAQGNKAYKIVLRHKGQNNEPFPTYENFFEGPTEFSVISLSLDDFKPYYRGRPLNSSEAEPLDISDITSFGLQIYGGVYSPIKQHGPSSLEIDWIVAV